MNEKQLIFKLQELKKIKPNKKWVVFTKNDILGINTFDNKVANKWTYRELLSIIFKSSFQRKFAYALASFLFIIAMVTGFMNYNFFSDSNVKTAQQSTAALAEIKNNVEVFKAKSKNLTEVSKGNSQDISLALEEVKDAAKNLTDTIQKDPKLARTFLDITGIDDLKQTSDNLNKTIENIDNQIIEDSEKTTLTESQKEKVDKAKDLVSQGKYYDALELLLSE